VIALEGLELRRVTVADARLVEDTATREVYVAGPNNPRNGVRPYLYEVAPNRARNGVRPHLEFSKWSLTPIRGPIATLVLVLGDRIRPSRGSIPQRRRTLA